MAASTEVFAGMRMIGLTVLAALVSVSLGVLVVRGGAQTAPATTVAASDANRALDIAEGHRVAAPRGDHLILLLDFNPNRKALEAAGAAAADMIVATATKYAREYLAKPEYASIAALDAYIVFVDSMDEYNRANYAGMKRFGTVAFARRDGDIVMTDNKLTFAP